METTQDNFFVRELQQYFAGSDMPPALFGILTRPLASLDAREAAEYNAYIGPYLDKIRGSLQACFLRAGSPGEEWSASISPYRRSIAEELAAQVLGMSAPNTLPASLFVPLEGQTAAPAAVKHRGRFSLPSLSRGTLIAAAAFLLVLALAVGGTWYYYHATAASRGLARADALLERGEYEAAYRAYEDVRTRYAGKQEAVEAEESQEEAAFAYAERLKGEARYEEALTYYDLAFDHEVERCCVDCHFARAGQLQSAGDYEKAFQQCENALKRAPADYDRNPVMQLRAEALFLWGDRYMQQGNYAAASSRFNKCLSEWPDGPLAGDAAVNYVDSTVASHSYQPPPSKEPAAAGRVELRIRNDSDVYSRFFFSGPSSLYVDLPAFASNTIYLTPGIYQTLLTAPDEHVKPFAAQDDYSEPTSSYSWWEITIPGLLEVPSGSGVSFEDILARLDQLKATLPPELVGCLDGIEFKADYAGAETEGGEGCFSPADKAIYFNPDIITPEGIDAIIMHEWGHAFSYQELSGSEKKGYKQLRGVMYDTPWEDYDKPQDSVEEDFAEVFAIVFDANVLWDDYTVYGPIVNPDQVREMILAAGR